MMNNNRTPVSDPYGSIKAAMSRGISHYYEDCSQARKKQILDKEKEHGTGKRHVSC